MRRMAKPPGLDHEPERSFECSQFSIYRSVGCTLILAFQLIGANAIRGNVESAICPKIGAEVLHGQPGAAGRALGVDLVVGQQCRRQILERHALLGWPDELLQADFAEALFEQLARDRLAVRVRRFSENSTAM